MTDSPGRLRGLPSEAKTAISFFYLYCIVGPVVNFAFHVMRVGTGLPSAREYYQGTPDWPAKSALEVLETTHFHLWIQGVVFFLAAFVFSMGRLPSPRWRFRLVVIGFASSILHVVSPLFARIGGMVPVACVFAGAAGTTLSLWTYALFVLVDMWRDPARAQRS